MLPRPVLTTTFGLSYRKIPILAIGRDVYCDTSIIIEALEHQFSASNGWGTVYPSVVGEGGSEWDYSGLVKAMVAWWTDRSLFRTTTGLIPSSAWSTSFGADRANLIGHKLDPSKLGAKIPQNLSTLDLHLSLLEPTLQSSRWLLPVKIPSLADLSVFYQLRWGTDIAAGKGIYNLTAGGTGDTVTPVTDSVFSKERYPSVWRWFHDFESYVAALPDLESPIDPATSNWKAGLAACKLSSWEEILLSTPAPSHPSLDGDRGLVPGASVSIAPDDTGRDHPTLGKLVAIGVEEVVIEPEAEREVDVRVHFPRLGFVVRSVGETKL